LAADSFPVLFIHCRFRPYLLFSASSHLLSASSPPAPIYTLSLHDALPIYLIFSIVCSYLPLFLVISKFIASVSKILKISKIFGIDRKSTRLNSSHVSISYAVFCLKKKITDKNNAYLVPVASARCQEHITEP